MLTIHTTKTPLEDAADALNALLRDATGKDTLLLLSGGSALALADKIDASLLGPHVTVSVLDERFTYAAEDSNTTQLMAAPFWKHAQMAGVAHIDPRPHEPESLEDAAQRFDLALKHWHITHRDGVVLATMGIGPDGHTSGVLPMPEDPTTFSTLFEHTTTCVRGYRARPEVNPHTQRMTTTLTYLARHVDHAVVYVSGASKHDALVALTAPEGTRARTPARILHVLRSATLYTDVAIPAHSGVA